MIILLGKGVYLGMWVFFIINLIFPYPRPANILCNIALCAMILLHGLQAFLFASTRTEQEKLQDKWAVLRFFIFGVFEVMSWKKKNQK